jgi:hypothetical protein
MSRSIILPPTWCGSGPLWTQVSSKQSSQLFALRLGRQLRLECGLAPKTNVRGANVNEESMDATIDAPLQGMPLVEAAKLIHRKVESQDR